MEQIIREISDKMKRRIEAQRDWVRNHYEPDSTYKYNSIEGKLRLLDIILKSNWIEKDETNKLQCLGITFGDILVQDLNFRWIEVDDENGLNPAIKLGETSLIMFPLTMISKRIERDETVDIYDLYSKSKLKAIELKDKIS